jgi:hypothetical protein
LLGCLLGGVRCHFAIVMHGWGVTALLPQEQLARTLPRPSATAASAGAAGWGGEAADGDGGAYGDVGRAVDGVEVQQQVITHGGAWARLGVE